MYFTKVMLLVFLGISSLHDGRAQTGLMIGNYIISGQARFAKEGINLNINAKQIQPGEPTKRPVTLAEGGNPSPSAGPDVGGKSESDAVYQGLDAHNAYREIHMAQPLELSSELNKNAQNYASYLAENGVFEHDSNRKGEGENLGLVCDGPSTDAENVKKIVKAWYMEVCDYDFNKPGFDGKTGHFTQVAWKGTTQLGIGFAKGTYTGYSNCGFVVGRYKEAGNMMGEFPENVEKGSFNRDETCKDYQDYKPYGKRNKLIKNSLIKLITSRKTSANTKLQLIL